jgi:hypothetical protein
MIKGRDEYRGGKERERGFAVRRSGRRTMEMTGVDGVLSL